MCNSYVHHIPWPPTVAHVILTEGQLLHQSPQLPWLSRACQHHRHPPSTGGGRLQWRYIKNFLSPRGSHMRARARACVSFYGCVCMCMHIEHGR